MTSAGFVGRVGGLAAALGAGVVVGLAVASPASADDTGAADPGPRAAASAHSAGRAAPDATQVKRRGTAVPAASTGSDPARPAAVVSASRVVRTAATVEVPAPKAVANQGGSAPRAAEPVLAAATVATRPAAPSPAAGTAATPLVTQPAAPVAAAPTPATAATSLQSLLCDPRGRQITVFRGVHFVIPQSPAIFVKKVSGTGTFTTDSVYDLKDVDQYDWNKFTGIAFSPIQHDRNSVMVGWRYNLTSQEFEIAPFYNVNKERILPNEQTEVISVPAGETFQYNVDYSGVTISYGDKTVFKPYPPGLTPNIWTAVRVSGWFGGNEVAPRTLSYYLKMK
jgi:hypothetical protein